MTEAPFEIYQRRLALFVHPRKVRLQQHTAPRIEQSLGVRQSRIELGTPVTLRVAGSGADGRLHNQLGGLEMRLEKPPQHGGRILSRLNEGAGHNGRAGSRQLSQVMLVCIPTNQRQGI